MGRFERKQHIHSVDFYLILTCKSKKVGTKALVSPPPHHRHKSSGVQQRVLREERNFLKISEGQSSGDATCVSRRTALAFRRNPLMSSCRDESVRGDVQYFGRFSCQNVRIAIFKMTPEEIHSVCCCCCGHRHLKSTIEGPGGL